MKSYETRPLPKSFLKTLRAHKKELIKMEKENNALIADLENIIRTYKTQEGETPVNVDFLSTFLYNRKYEIEALKRCTRNAIEEAKGE